MSKKTVIIFVIVLSLGVLFQTMVIIDYYSENFNLGFFRQKNETGTYYKSLDANISDKFFVPHEIIIRFENRPFVIRSGENLFDDLWNDSRDVVDSVLTGEFSESILSWDQVCGNDGVTVALGNYFPVEYIELMIGTENNNDSGFLIDKFMIIPGESGMDVYFHTDDSVYEFKAMQPYGLFSKDNFHNITDLLTRDPNYNNSYYTDIYKVISKAVWENYIEPDILISNDLSHHIIPWVFAGLPDTINDYISIVGKEKSESRDALMDDAVSAIKRKLLIRSNNLFTTHFDSFGNLFFINQFNLYKIEKDGWVSYNYTPGTEGDERGSIGNAFTNAYETINTISGLASEYRGELFVSGVQVNEDSYTFRFDYKYNSMIVAIKDENHAALITATATRTIEARMLPLNFSKMAEDTQVEIPYIFNFGSNLRLNDINDLNAIEAYNIYVGYGTFSGNQNLIGPVWIIEEKSGKKEIYNLQRGDE